MPTANDHKDSRPPQKAGTNKNEQSGRLNVLNLGKDKANGLINSFRGLTCPQAKEVLYGLSD
jgi:hypothetical protein